MNGSPLDVLYPAVQEPPWPAWPTPTGGPWWAIIGDFNMDGDYEVNLTGRFTALNGSLTMRRGMGPDGRYQSSSISGSFLNDDGALTPDYSSSPLFGFVYPGVGLRVYAAFAGEPLGTVLWTGYISHWRHSWDAGRPNVGISEWIAEDLAALLREVIINLTNSASVLTGAAIGNILDETGLTGAGDRSLDTGQQTLPNHYVVEQDALQAIADVVAAECGGLAWITREGALRFEDRSQRLGVTADGTWGDGTDIVPSEESLEYDSRDLVRDVAVQATPQQAGSAGTVVAAATRNENTGDSLSIPPLQEIEFDLPLNTPVSALVTPVSTTDYKANTAADGTGTDRTSSLGVTVTNQGGTIHVKLRNNHAADTIFYTKFQIRGTPVIEVPDRPLYRRQQDALKHKTGGSSHARRIPFVGEG